MGFAMVGEALAAGLSAAFDIARGLKDIDDAARRNAAVLELQVKILAAQSDQAVLVERLGALEKELARLKDWETEKARYQLTDFGENTFAYSLKPEAALGEPPHRLCPTCYDLKRQKSVLQFRGRDAFKRDIYQCPACRHEYAFGVRQQWAGGRSDYNPRRGR
jgi:DNA-directed RNA polymerase subunit M/transcription elongation factor TFIIS